MLTSYSSGRQGCEAANGHLTAVATWRIWISTSKNLVGLNSVQAMHFIHDAVKMSLAMIGHW